MPSTNWDCTGWVPSRTNTTRAPGALSSGWASASKCACARRYSAISGVGTRCTMACCARNGSSALLPMAPARGADIMHDALLQGALVRLAVPNPETDSETIAAWTRDPEFQHLLETGAPRPWSARAVKADMAEMLGDEKPREHEYSFVIRALADDQLIGFPGLEVNHWSQRNASIIIGIAPPA